MAGEPRDLPGMNPGVSALPSSDPSLSGSTLSQYATDQLRQTADSMRTYMMFTNDFTSKMREGLRQLDGLVGDIGKTRGSVSSGSDPSTDPSGRPVSVRANEPDTAPRLSFSEGRDMGQRMRMGDVTHGFARAASQVINNHGTTWSTEGGMAVERDGRDQIIRSLPVGAPGTAETVAKSTARTSRMNLAAGALGRYGAGEGVAGAIGGTVAKLAGPVGVAVGIVQQGFDKWGEQTAAGAPWRQIYGEDAGRFAVKQRLGQQVSGLKSYFSGTGHARGMEAYSKMAGLGLTGDALGAATDFDQEMYLKHGMDSDQSSSFVKMARTTGESLSDLTKQIAAVSDAALSAGVNVESVQQSFMGLASSIRTNVSNTSGSNATAANLTATVTGNLPKAIATDSTMAGLAGALTESNAVTAARATGQDWRTLNQQMGLGVGNAQNTVIDQTLKEMTREICAIMRTTPERLAAEIKAAYGDVRTLSPEDQASVLSKYPMIAQQDIQRMYAQRGMNFPLGDAVSIFFEQVMGNMDLSGVKPKGPLDALSAAMDKNEVVQGGFNDLKTTGYGADTKRAELAKSMGVMAGATTEPAGFGTYADWAESSGNRNKGIEAMLTGAGKDKIEKFAGTDIDHAKFQTTDGQKSLAEIMSNPTYLAQLDSLTVVSKDANEAGMKVSDVTGYGGSTDGKTKSDGSSATDANGLTLYLSDYAKMMFKITGPSEYQKNGVAAAYVPPSEYSNR